ncbi:MAG TPA: hypothetical protein PKE12_00330 [Kiritimatiellia bacterium]|nr:hypothetical protein [Kiritimatiellia bacterium]
MADNAVFVFPILYAGRTPAGPNEYVALNNLILSLAPKAASVRYAQALVYANFDYMWRFNLPPMLWPLARPMLRWSRRRLAWGRLYLDGVHSQAYRVQLEHDRLRLRYAANADIPLARQILAELRTALNREGFHIPALPPVLQKANSHYACTMPYGNRGPLPVAADGGIAPGIHLCDSTVFPNLPAVSLTFTIMANAWRTAAEALGGRSP